MESNNKFTPALEAYLEWQKPIYHIPVNLGINKFKKEARAAGLSKAFVNKLIRAYKRRSWMEYKGTARYRGSFPVHPTYGNSVEVIVEDNKETTVNVSKTNNQQA